MNKLLAGAQKFNSGLSTAQKEQFAELAAGQYPQALFITCVDSRLVPSLITGTQVGDILVHRNVGNLVPADNANSDFSELAAIEFGLKHLQLKNIIVCGHSECGAMKALMNQSGLEPHSHLSKWIQQASSSQHRVEQVCGQLADGLSELNQLSQANVLQQLENLQSYPFIQEAIERQEVSLHAWWFDIATATVFAYNEASGEFEALK